MQIVSIDIGGTHARFALAEVEHGRVVMLGEPVTLKTSDHASLPAAWQSYGAAVGGTLPSAAAIAIAAPLIGETIRLTNNAWVIAPARLCEQLAVDRCHLVNDFEAVGHAVAQAGPGHFEHLCGPDRDLPSEGTISIVGPGTGLGVASLHRSRGHYRVQATEGGHFAFAPCDAVEDAILARVRQRLPRVSVERIVSGPGIVEIYAVLAGQAAGNPDDVALWSLGLSGEDAIANRAIDRFCAMLGAVAGDVVLVQGGFAGVVIAGGLGLRLKDRLRQSGFAAGFCTKGRYEKLMADIPVRLITHPQPGLFGAAAAFAAQYPE